MAVDPSKHRLLEAAGHEFAEKGFEGASVRSICKRAEMNIAAVNYHFGDKDQLYIDAVLEAHRCGKAPLLSEDEPPFDDPQAQLRAHIGNMMRSMLSIEPESWHEALMFREMMRPTMASGALVSQAIRPKFDRLRAVLERLVPGIAGRDLDAVAFSIVGQCLFYRVGRPIMELLIGEEGRQAIDVDFLTDHITRFTLAAVGHGPSRFATEEFAESAVAESKGTGP